MNSWIRILCIFRKKTFSLRGVYRNMNRGGLKLFFNRKGGGLNEAGVDALRVLEIPLKGEFHFSSPALYTTLQSLSWRALKYHEKGWNGVKVKIFGWPWFFIQRYPLNTNLIYSVEDIIVFLAWKVFDFDNFLNIVCECEEVYIHS